MLCQLTVKELSEKIRSGFVSSREATQACLDRIQQVDPQVHAFLSVNAEDALAQADAADARLRVAIETGSKISPLLGVPIGMKDLIAVKDHPLGCASKILEGFISPYDATVTTKLREAGAIPLGRLNMDEFAMGSSTENSAYGRTNNPWGLDLVPGGSSGGSAAAVAASEVYATLGSDTGGSIRQPASFCGCVGMKPTYGRVSRYGLVAFASSLDQIGPYTKTVEDSAIMLEAISGHDPLDSTSVPEPVPQFSEDLKRGVKGLKIGLPKEYFIDGMDPEVRASVENAVRELESQGAEVVEISLPHTDYAVATYYILATAEASANLARFEGIRYGLRVDGEDLFQLNSRTRGQGFGDEVKRRVLLGTYVLSSGYYDAYYNQAQKVRSLIFQDFQNAFEKVDIIATPATPTVAFKAGEKANDPLSMYLCDIFTISCNLAGICGLSLPCGLTQDPRLPIGLQLLGRPFGESQLLQAAYAFEQTTDLSQFRPQAIPAP